MRASALALPTSLAAVRSAAACKFGAPQNRLSKLRFAKPLRTCWTALMRIRAQVATEKVASVQSEIATAGKACVLIMIDWASKNEGIFASGIELEFDRHGGPSVDGCVAALGRRELPAAHSQHRFFVQKLVP